MGNWSFGKALHNLIASISSNGVESLKSFTNSTLSA